MIVRRLVLVLVVVALFAGCLGSIDSPLDETDRTGDDPEPDVDDVTPAVGLVPQHEGACDRSLVEGVYAREPDVVADPNDRDRLAAGLMVEIPSTADAGAAGESDEPVWTGLARSGDGGENWDFVTLSGYPGDADGATSPFAGSAIVGDPVVDFLPDGTLLLMGLMVKADSSTTLWTARYPDDALRPSEVNIVARGALPVPAGSDLPTPYQVAYNDKPYMNVDPATGDVHAAWSWRGNLDGSRAIPMYAKSTDGGKTWTEPTSLVEADATYATGDAFHVGAHPFVGTDGSVHVVWWESREGVLYHTVSRDGGETFPEPAVLGEAHQGLSSYGGVLGGSIPQAGVDRSGGPHHGSLYVTWADERDGDSDLRLRVSRDDGATWSDPASIHPDRSEGMDDVQPVLAAGPDGSVSVLHYRVLPGDDRLFEAHLARSTDGGESFDGRVLTAEPSNGEDTADAQPVGDYIGLTYDADGPVGVWQDGRMGEAEDPYSEAYLCELTPGS